MRQERALPRGCSDEVPETRWLKGRRRIFSQCRKGEVRDRRPCRAGFPAKAPGKDVSSLPVAPAIAGTRWLVVPPSGLCCHCYAALPLNVHFISCKDTSH